MCLSRPEERVALSRGPGPGAPHGALWADSSAVYSLWEQLGTSARSDKRSFLLLPFPSTVAGKDNRRRESGKGHKDLWGLGVQNSLGEESALCPQVFSFLFHGKAQPSLALFCGTESGVVGKFFSAHLEEEEQTLGYKDSFVKSRGLLGPPIQNSLEGGPDCSHTALQGSSWPGRLAHTSQVLLVHCGTESDFSLHDTQLAAACSAAGFRLRVCSVFTHSLGCPTGMEALRLNPEWGVSPSREGVDLLSLRTCQGCVGDGRVVL